MRHMLHRVAIAALVVFAAFSYPVQAADKAPVVELFTSQGCSSCPPADALLVELAKRDDVIALSYHVDYWNYIGWKDPFSMPASTQRQQAYRAALGTRYVYTPQVVVDGKLEVVGSSRDAVEGLIAAARSKDRLPITVHRSQAGVSTVRIPAMDLEEGAPAVILRVDFDREHTTPVKRGENRGATLTNANVVRAISRIADYSGKAVELRIDHSKLRAKGRDGCAIIVQRAKGGPILGAAAVAAR